MISRQESVKMENEGQNVANNRGFSTATRALSLIEAEATSSSYDADLGGFDKTTEDKNKETLATR